MGLFGGAKKRARQARRAGEKVAEAIDIGRPIMIRGGERALAEFEGDERFYREMLPYQAFGAQALQQFEMPAPVTGAEVRATPGYQFRMQEAQRAMERGAAARGGLMGGAHQRSLARYMQGLASQEFMAEEQRRQQRAALQLQFALGAGGIGAGAAGDIMRTRMGLAERRAGIHTGVAGQRAASLQAAAQARASGVMAGLEAGGGGGFMQGLGTLAGGAIGAYFGGPMGAQAGAQIGGAAGGMLS